MPTFTKGEKAPAFELATTDGRKISLGDALARGQVLVAFFKVNCPTCQYAFPFIERLHQQFTKATIFGVSQNKEESTRNFAAECGISFPLLLDPEPYEISRAYRLRATPTFYLIGPNGGFELVSEGFAKRDLIEIQRALAQDAGVNAPPELFKAGERIPEYKPG